MSYEIAIQVENLSKSYLIYDKPHDRLLQMLFRGRKRFFREFWALEDVSFSVQKGETVGIIGRNGSGKSTLLQMICGTLNPTNGSIKTNGRIAALLELGSGFNPEFTGRENIYLNGAVLGLSQREIDLRYEEIINFADIGDFIEQPVKTYSSGMQVRLAFSVAINVSPDILVVDEALSVGDAYFQAKCAKAIFDIIERGTTVLFVSHDISSIKTLCNKALLLKNGRLVYSGDVNSAVEKYYSDFVQEKKDAAEDANLAEPVAENSIAVSTEPTQGSELFQKMAEFQRINNGDAAFINVLILDQHNKPIDTVSFGEKIKFRQIIKIKKSLDKLSFAYHLRDKNGQDLIYSDTEIEDVHLESLKPDDIYIIDWEFEVNLKEGNYVLASMASMPINLKIGDVTVVDFIPISAKFSVAKRDDSPLYGAVYWNNKITVSKVENK